jgi:hypothetical protein
MVRQFLYFTLDYIFTKSSEAHLIVPSYLGRTWTSCSGFPRSMRIYCMFSTIDGPSSRLLTPGFVGWHLMPPLRNWGILIKSPPCETVRCRRMLVGVRIRVRGIKTKWKMWTRHMYDEPSRYGNFKLCKLSVTIRAEPIEVTDTSPLAVCTSEIDTICAGYSLKYHQSCFSDLTRPSPSVQNRPNRLVAREES